MSAKVYNHQTKQWELLNDDDVDAAVQSGNYTFEQGVKIPVVAEDGELGYVPSENLHEAFKSGFRWQTQADRDTDFAGKSEAIKEEHFGDQTGTALAGGILRGATLGLSDVAIGSVGLEDAAKEVKDRNVGASIAGTVAGSFIPLPGVGMSVAGVGTKLGTRATSAIPKAAEGLTRAQKALRGVGAAGLGSVVEGAFFGVGEGISETALGDPDHLVDNLVAGVGFGALTGGVLGAGFGTAGAAKPFLQDAFDRTADVVSKAGKAAVRKSVKGLGKAVLSVTESRQIAKDFADLADDPEFLQVVSSGTYKEVRDFGKQMRGARQQIEREGKQLQKDLGKELSTVENTTAQRIVDEVAAQKGDIERARSQLFEEFKNIGDARSSYIQQLSDNNLPAQSIASWQPKIDSAIYAMERSGVPALESKAKELSTLVNARTKTGTLNMGDELNLMRELKDATNQDARKMLNLKGAHYDTVKDFERFVSKELHEYPIAEIANANKAYDSAYSAYLTLNKFSKKYKGETFIHPESVRQLAPVLSKLEAFAPDLRRLSDAAKDTAQYASVMRETIAKARELSGTKLDDAVTVEAFESLMGQISGAKSGRLTEIARTLEGLDALTPMEQAIRLQKALGNDVSKLEKFLPFQNQIGAMDRLRKVEAGSATGLGVLGSAAIGSTLGGVPGAIFGLGTAVASNPARAIHMLGAIERASNAGVKKLQKSFRRVTDGLVSETARRVSVATKTRSEPVVDKRKRYQAVMTAASRALTPQGAMSAIAEMSGDTPGLNSLKTSMGQRLQSAALYIDAVAPKDPLAGSSVLIQDSGWEPSDAQLATFMRRVDVVNDPTKAVDRMADGTVTVEEVEALKTVHPEIYASLQQTIVGAIMERGNKIPYTTRLQLGTLFGIPTDYSMTPEFIARMQSAYTPQDLGGRPEGTQDSKPRKKNIDVSPFDSVATEVSRLTYGDVQ